MPVDQERRQTADDQQQHEQGKHPQRVGADRLQVDGHPRCDEEDRDEDPVPDSIELMLEALGVQVEPPSPDAQHDPGQHRAEHDVEAESGREREQREQQDHRPAQRDLRGRVLALVNDPLDRAALGQPRHQRQDDGYQPDCGYRGQRDEVTPLSEEHGDDQDREELPDGPGSEHVPAELAAEHAVVPQDGQQRAQRGGGQRQADRHVVLDIAGRRQSGRHRHRDHGRHHPAGDRQPAGPLSQQVRVELVAGQQEEEPEPHIGQQLDIPGLGQPEDMGADHHAADEEHDNLRNARAGQDGDHERRQGGDQRHRQQVVQPLKNVHDGLSALRHPAIGTPRAMITVGVPSGAILPT